MEKTVPLSIFNNGTQEEKLDKFIILENMLGSYDCLHIHMYIWSKLRVASVKYMEWLSFITLMLRLQHPCKALLRLKQLNKLLYEGSVTLRFFKHIYKWLV